MQTKAVQMPSVDIPKPLALPWGTDEVSLARILMMCSLPD